MNRRFRLGGTGADYTFEVGTLPTKPSDPESPAILRSLIWEASSQVGGRVERAIVEVFRQVFGRSPSGWSPREMDAGQRARLFETIANDLAWALNTERLRLRDDRARIAPSFRTAPEASTARASSGTTTTVEDVWVVAAEVKLFGDTPLIDHEVRILDPDTGAVVADGLRTDQKGIVRAEVPTRKNYRIEIVDKDPQWHPMMVPDPPQGLLRCELVDEAGAPLAHEDVAVASDQGEMTVVTDEDGRIDIAAILGHYALTVKDQTFHVHALLSRDQGDEKGVYRLVVKSEAEAGTADDPENRLHRFDDRIDPESDPFGEEEMFA